MNEPQALPLEVAREVYPPIWVIYARPADYPQGFVVRKWWGLTPEPASYRYTNIVECREHAVMEGASVPFAHAPGSEAECIAETWL